MVVRGLLSSWTMPAAIWPSEASFSDWITWARSSCWLRSSGALVPDHARRGSWPRGSRRSDARASRRRSGARRRRRRAAWRRARAGRGSTARSPSSGKSRAGSAFSGLDARFARRDEADDDLLLVARARQRAPRDADRRSPRPRAARRADAEELRAPPRRRARRRGPGSSRRAGDRATPPGACCALRARHRRRVRGRERLVLHAFGSHSSFPVGLRLGLGLDRPGSRASLERSRSRILAAPDVALRLVAGDLSDLADDVGHPLRLLEDDRRGALHGLDVESSPERRRMSSA